MLFFAFAILVSISSFLPRFLLICVPRYVKCSTSYISSFLILMLLLIFVLILTVFVLLMFIFRPVLEAVSSNLFVFFCMSSNLLDISVMSSANSRSSSLFIKFYLIPVFLPSTLSTASTEKHFRK